MKGSIEKFKVIDNLLIPEGDEDHYNSLVNRLANLEKIRYYDRTAEKEYQDIEDEINDSYKSAIFRGIK